MVRLSGMEAVWLHTETSTTPAHAVAVLVMEDSESLNHERLHKLAGSSLPHLARFRSRLVGKPFGLGQPVWAEIDGFNPSRQLRRVAVAPPGGPAEFADLIGKLNTRPLPRDMPLWQAWSIEGLEDGRWALALKMSLAVTGGLAGVPSVLERLVTVNPDEDPSAAGEQGFGKEPSILELVADTAVELAANQLNGALQLSRATARAVANRLRGGDDGSPVPRTV